MLKDITTLRPLDAARAARRLFANPDETEHVFEIIDALQGPTLPRVINRLQGSPEGRRLLQTKPDMLSLLCDREALARLPEGSLGRAYLRFVEAEGITADGLVEASKRGWRDEAADRRWVRDWLRDTHDLWHTVLGYQGDLVGEAALLAFSHYQTGNMGVALIASIAWFKLGRVTDPELEARRVVVQGRERAKQARWFLDVPWHEWLERPLQEVRQDLGATNPVPYSPVRSYEVDVSFAV